MSGIDISEELLGLFEEVKLRHKHKFIIFSLKQTGKVGTKITFDWSIDTKADPVADAENKAAFEAMLKELPSDDARFVVFDFADTKADGRQIKKLVLIKWCPDSVSFRVKPVVGATYQTLKEKLTGLGKDIQASDASDLAYEAIKASL